MVSDEQLMLDVGKGRGEAFDTLFERHRDAVWRFFRRRVADAARCEDLVQDVFVAVYQNARRYEPRSTVRSYVFAIAFNTLHAERRRVARRATDPIADEPVVASDPAAALWVREALASLDADAREIVMLREYEQLSYQEIADLLRLPLNTVRSRLFRARMDLKEALGGRNVGRNVRSASEITSST